MINESMTRIISAYLADGFPYRFQNGPREVPNRQVAQNEGLNCIALVHLLLRDLYQVALPTDLRCYEMFVDKEHFIEVNSLAELRIGDVLLVGPQSFQARVHSFVPRFDEHGELLNQKEFPLHLIIFVGNSPTGELNFIHANYIDKTIGIWSLEQLLSTPRYNTIFKIKRVKTLDNKLE